MDEIKTCPFCGGRADLNKDPLWTDSGHGYKGHYKYYIRCANYECPIRPETDFTEDIYGTPENAIQRVITEWNKRPDTQL